MERTLLVAASLVAVALGVGWYVSRDAGRHTATISRATPRTSIVVQWPEEEFGPSVFSVVKIYRLEDFLTKHAGGLYEVDGHDIGSGTVNIFLFAPDADAEAAVRRVIDLYQQGRLRLGMRVGVAQEYNADRTDWTYRPAYPPDLRRFDLMG
jgi:hypothetical protein